MSDAPATKVDDSLAVRQLDAEILRAVDKAKAAGVSYGLIIAMLHGHLWKQTQEMME